MLHKTKSIALIGIAVLFFSSSCVAATIKGARSCGDWLKYKPTSEDKPWPRIAHESWLLGYLSGIAVATGTDALKGSTVSSFYLWMDNYCQTNPLDDIDDGGSKLYLELIKRKGL